MANATVEEVFKFFLHTLGRNKVVKPSSWFKEGVYEYQTFGEWFEEMTGKKLPRSLENTKDYYGNS